jgi:hypothetical protein
MTTFGFCAVARSLLARRCAAFIISQQQLIIMCLYSQLWKNRYAVVDGNTLTVFRNEADAKANKDVRLTLALNESKLSSVR